MLAKRNGRRIDMQFDLAKVTTNRGVIFVIRARLESGANALRRKVAMRTALMAGTVELFFAMLPLLVFWMYWPAKGVYHPSSLWASVELPMISCVIFGLCLIRWIQGNVVRASSLSQQDEPIRTGHLSAATIFISIFPLGGVIFSCLSIMYTMSSSSGSWSPFNLFLLMLAVVMWYGLGGYGMFAGEAAEARRDDS